MISMIKIMKMMMKARVMLISIKINGFGYIIDSDEVARVAWLTIKMVR